MESRKNLKALLAQEQQGTQKEVSPIESLAQALDDFSYDHDYYNYQDYVNDREAHIRELIETLDHERDSGYRAFLTDFIEETEDAGARADAIALLDRLDAFLSPEQEEEVVLNDIGNASNGC